MEEEFFYGITLDKNGASEVWCYNDYDDEEQFAAKLFIRQILLGKEAKEGEYNVVEVETMSQSEIIKIPVAVLKVGETRSLTTNLEFPHSPVTFKLIEGNGPVYIHGNQIPAFAENMAEKEEEEEVELIGEQDDEVNEMNMTTKKRKLEENGSGNHKSNQKPVK